MGEKNTFQKQSLWTRATRVPVVVAGHGIGGGRRCDRVVSLLDLYPTLLDLCDLPPNAKNEGRSWVPLLKDPTRAWPHPAIIGWKENSFAVQGERYRYSRYSDGSEELYDHEADPNEWTNLSGDPAHAEVKTTLAKVLNTLPTPKATNP